MTKQGSLEAKDLEKMNASEEAPSSSFHNSIVTCEELTLRNCSGVNLDVISNLSSTDKLQTAQTRQHDPLLDRLGYRGSPTRVNVLEDVGCSSKSDLDRKTSNNQGSVDTASHGDAGEFRDQSYPEASSFNKLDKSAPLNSNRGVVLQVDESTHQNVSREMVRSPPRVIPNSGTLLDSNREIGVAPLRAIPNQVRNLNRVTPRPPPRVIPSQTFFPVFSNPISRFDQAMLNLAQLLATPLHQAIPNLVPQTITPLHQAIPNLVPQTITPLHQAIPNPGTLSNSSSQIGMPRATPSLFPNSNSETVMLHHDGVSLREWLKFGENKRNKLKSLYIFKQIVDTVSDLHSKGIILLDLRPSYFKLMKSDKVTYIGSDVQIENLSDQDDHYQLNYQNEKRPMDYINIPDAKRKKLGECPKLVISEPQFPNESGLTAANENNVRDGGPQFTGNVFCDKSNTEAANVTGSDTRGENTSDSSKLILGSGKNASEEVKWYASPEELNRRQCMLSSNIYSLGILLVELLCSFDSESGRDIAMLNLHNSILPLDFLAGNPREAELCLWLLHPEPSLRPSIREILKSDVIKEIEDLINSSSSSSSSSNLYDTELDLLLHFLESLQQTKHLRTSKLMEEINYLETDIREVKKRQRKMSLLPEESVHARAEVPGQSSSGVDGDKSASFCNKERFIKNIDELEGAYFYMRATANSSNNGPIRCDVKDLFKCQETSSYLKKSTEGLGVFYDGLSKYARYTNFKVCRILRNENIHSSNIVCSLSFDPNEEYFAAAGVSKKIKIYDFHAVLNNSVDIHYPLAEMSNNSKLSCTSWNNYITNYLASTDYDGGVKLWDAGTGKALNQYTEHSRRTWSVDFSHTHPTTFASAGDDGCVKIWEVSSKSSVSTIQSISKLCCVQFSGISSHLFAYGSADSKTYCCDIRNTSKPWCVLSGHASPVSYVKFLDSKTLVSASTDNTLKIWELSTASCIETLRGHTNEKSFVGLSVTDDGYIMCGSETNEVFAYHRCFSMPITSYKFGLIDPITGKEDGDEERHFVTSVCSQKKSELMLAGNSSGCIKVLQLV